jgi:hypothetical protein
VSNLVHYIKRNLMASTTCSVVRPRKLRRLSHTPMLSVLLSLSDALKIHIDVFHTVTDSIKLSFLHADISLADVSICLPLTSKFFLFVGWDFWS